MNASIQHGFSSYLLELLPSRVWNNELPMRDSAVTNTEVAVVVELISDVTARESDCGGETRRALIQATLYLERCDDCEQFEIGALSNLERAITKYMRGFESYSTDALDVYEFSRQSSTRIDTDNKNMQAMATTYSVSYTLC